MITDLPVLDAADLPVVTWTAGDAVAGSAQRADLARLSCHPDDLTTLAAALREGGPRVRLEIGPGRWSGDVDVAALVAGGVVECRIDTSAFIDAGDWVRFVATLVAAREHGLAPEWTAPDSRPAWVCAELLHHLAPPVTGDDEADVAMWAAAHSFGTLYWRRGPGFVSVVDARDDATARYVIDDPHLVELFGTLARPTELGALTPDDRRRLDELDDAALVVIDGGLAVRLPYRLRHRPMPGNRV